MTENTNAAAQNEVVDAGGGILVDTGTPAKAPVKKATKKATKKAATPKAAKKGAKKAPAKAAKKASKKAPTGEKKPRAKKDGLGKTRVRILKALAKAPNGLTGAQLAEKADVHASLIGNQVGYRDPEINAREVHAGNLVNNKLVKIEQKDVKGKDTYVYTITAAGKEAIKKAE